MLLPVRVCELVAFNARLPLPVIAPPKLLATLVVRVRVDPEVVRLTVPDPVRAGIDSLKPDCSVPPAATFTVLPVEKTPAAESAIVAPELIVVMPV